MMMLLVAHNIACLCNVVTVRLWSCESCSLGPQTPLKSVNFIQVHLSFQLVQFDVFCAVVTLEISLFISLLPDKQGTGRQHRQRRQSKYR